VIQRIPFLLAIAAATLIQVEARAAATAPANSLEEVIVTAQKREQTLQEVPIAITVVRGEAMEQAQVRDLRDLQRLTTSLVVAQADSASNEVFSIRGMSTSGFNAGLESAVGVVIDGVYRGRQVEAVDDLVDIDQVEVLRGPQSTLFGKNTTAGVINIRTKAPNFESGGFYSATLGNFNALSVSGAANIPLTASTAALRISGSFNRRDGFIENLQNGKKINDRLRGSVHAQLLLLPSDTVTVRLIADVSALHERCCAAPFLYNDPGNVAVLESIGGTVLQVGPYDRKVKFDAGMYTRESNSGLSAQVDWDLRTMLLTSITSFRYYDQYDETDSDFTDLSLVGYNASSSLTRTFSQEVRLASKTKGAIDWLAGLYYFQQDMTSGGPSTYGKDLRNFVDVLSGGYVAMVEEGLGLNPGTFFAPGQGLVNEHYVQNGHTTAGFGNLDFHVSDRWTLSAGLRYETAVKSVRSDIHIDDPFAALDFTTLFDGQLAGLGALQFFPPVANFAKSLTESDVSGKATIAYAPSAALNLYGSFAHGVKAGGFNLSTTASQSGFSFRPERVDAYEIGAKTRWLNNRLTVNLAAFDERVKDYQADEFNGIAFILENAGSIRLRGLELETSSQLGHGFYADFGATYLLGTIESFPNGPCPLGATTASCDLGGKRVPDAPRWTVAAGGHYEWPVNDHLTGFAQAGARLRTSRYIMLSNEPMTLTPTTTEVDASAGIRGASDRWELTLWGRNITGAHYPQLMFNSVAQSGSLNLFPSDPATFGISWRAKY